MAGSARGKNRWPARAAYAALYFGVPALLAFAPDWARRRWGVELRMWVVPSLLAIAGAVLAVEKLRAKPPRDPALANAGRRPMKAELARVLSRFAFCASALAFALAAWRPQWLFAFPRQSPKFWLVVMVAYPLLSVAPQGVIYRWLFDRRFSAAFGSARASLVAGAAAFSFAHVVFRNPWALAFTFAGGLFFLSTYRRSGSLLLANIEHALYGNWLFTVGWGAFFYEGAA